MDLTKPVVTDSIYFAQYEKDYPSMEGKVVVITGTTSGTGFVAASLLAKKGAHVVVLNRKSQRAEDGLAKLKEASPNATIDWVECDLQSKASVEQAAAEIKEKYPSIDVLCCNAGVMALEDYATGDGYDVQMQTNHLSHFLLVKELFPTLEKTANEKGEARIVTHSSAARDMPSTPLDPKYYGKNGGNLGGESSAFQNAIFSGPKWERYHQTKLANSVFSQVLHIKLAAKGSKIKSLCAHPGLASTNLQVTTAKSGGMSQGFLGWITMKMSQSQEDGTMPLLECIGKPDAKSGEMYGPTKYMQTSGPAGLCDPGKLTMDGANDDVLWTESEKFSGSFAV